MVRPFHARFGLVLTIVLGLAATACSQDASHVQSQTTTDQLTGWVLQLDSDKYEERKLATEGLKKAGDQAVLPIYEAIKNGTSVEQQTRGFQILTDVALNSELIGDSAATQALEDLASHKQSPVARQAKATLHHIHSLRESRCIAALEKLGARFSFDQRNNSMPPPTQTFEYVSRRMANGVRLTDSWRGSASDLALLKYLPSFHAVECTTRKIGDEELAVIADADWINWLVLRRTSVTDKGLRAVSRLKNLQLLVVWYMPITESIFPRLAGLSEMEAVQMFGTKVTSDQTAKAHQASPTIHFDVRQGGFLGVSERLSAIPGPPGCHIAHPSPGTAADQAGLKDGDTIVKYDGKPVTSFLDLRELTGQTSAGKKIELDIIRRGNPIKITVELGEWSTNQMP